MKKIMAQLAAVLLTSWTMGVVGSPVYAAMTGNDTNGYLEINDDAIYTESVYGWNKTGMEDAISGKVIIGGNPVLGPTVSVHGGVSEQGNAMNNVVTINNGDFQGEISGGTSTHGNVSGNSVNVNGGTFSGQGYIYGGNSTQGDAIANTVAIVNGHLTGKNVYGGYTEQEGDVYDNSVTLTNITGGQLFNGGYSNGDGDVFNNTVTIYGSQFSHLNINGAEVGVNINGGVGKGEGKISNNTVIIKGNSSGFINLVSGGSGENGAVENNHVVISDLEFSRLSGTTIGNVYGGSSDFGEVTANSVTISNADVAANVYGGYSLNNANQNRVIISQGTITGGIHGGYSAEREANENTVFITDSLLNNGVVGGYSKYDNANGNQIVISQGTVNAYVYGGFGLNANGNQIYLSGGKITGNVIGGLAFYGTADNNLIQLSGDADVSEANLYGAYLSIGTGNSLVIDNWANHATQVVRGFNDITFKSVQWENGGTVLDITEETQTDMLKDTAVNVNNLVLANNQTLHVNDSMTFIQSSAETGLAIDNVNVNEEASFTQGVATVGTLEMQLEGPTENLIGKIVSVERNPQTNIILDSRVAGTAFVNQGADIAADSMDLLMNDHKYGVRTFGAVYGSRSKYDVDSDLKINGWNTILGVGNVHRRDHADLAWGVFYENSTGNYRVMNRFADEFFRGDGSLIYNGGGAAVRYKKDSGTYYEASLRVGTLNSSMSNAVKDGNGTFYGYDSDSTYWGTHLGIGKLIQNGSGEWNLYGKYFHTEIEGDSFVIGGDEFAFDDVTSDRLSLGARYTTDTASNWGVYYGLAWEYEFNGDSNMKAGQFEAPEKGLQGSTGIAEIGTTWRSEESPWGADINLKGYTGEREGFSGMVYLTYMF